MPDTGNLDDIAGQVPVAILLRRKNKERATGTLKLAAPEGPYYVYFLMGNAFHAESPGGTKGEDAVLLALDLQGADYDFNEKSALPATKTLKTDIASIVAKHVPKQGASPPAASQAGGTPLPAPAVPPAAYPGQASGQPVYAPVPVVYQTRPAAPRIIASAPSDWPEEVPPEAPPELPAEAPAPDGPEEPFAIDVAEGYGTEEDNEEPVAAESVEEDEGVPEMYRKGKAKAGQVPAHVKLFELPRGKTLHGPVSAGVIDFPKILRGMTQEGKTGYVRLKEISFTGLLLMQGGTVTDSFYEVRGVISVGEQAFQKVISHIEAGHGRIEVQQITVPVLEALRRMITTKPLYPPIPSSWFRLENLIEDVMGTKEEASVIIEGNDKTGVILIADGELLGSYTHEHPALEINPYKVLPLAEEPGATLTIRSTVPAPPPAAP